MRRRLNVEEAVRLRYEAGAKTAQKELCCAVSYDPKYLKVIPPEIIEKDYGCGDPSQYLRKGETALDLGSGGGKICYIASQVVGPTGKVIGVDFNPEMLRLARRYQSNVGDKIGYHNVEFRCGKIQDLRLDLDLVAEWVARAPVKTYEDYLALEEFKEKIAAEKPLIADRSIDVIVSNCVLNLVRTEDKKALFREMYRVLKDGGRAAVSDIVSDKDVPVELQQDPELWSGCVSGAFREDRLLNAFEETGFDEIEIVERGKEPFQIVDGIEFRSVTVMAHKKKQVEAKIRKFKITTEASGACGPAGCC